MKVVRSMHEVSAQQISPVLGQRTKVFPTQVEHSWAGQARFTCVRAKMGPDMAPDAPTARVWGGLTRSFRALVAAGVGPGRFGPKTAS
jgi:hypothetical protein